MWNADKKYWDTTTLNGSHLDQKLSIPNTVVKTDADTRPEKDATIYTHPRVDDIQRL